MEILIKFEVYFFVCFPFENNIKLRHFLEFEEYILTTHTPNFNSQEEPHANSDYIMKEFDKYERFLKKESLKLFREQRQAKLLQEQSKGKKKVSLHDFYKSTNKTLILFKSMKAAKTNCTNIEMKSLF